MTANGNQVCIRIVWGRFNSRWSETRESNEVYRRWMKCMYPHYSHLRKGEKTKFTLSLVKTLRKDKILCQKCITGSNKLVEMSDNELRIRLSQALREQWVKEPTEGMDSNEILSFRNFFLQQEHGHIDNEETATSQDDDLSVTESELEVKDEDDEMFSIEGDFSEIDPVEFDGLLIGPREIRELYDRFRSEPKASHKPYHVLG
ncbi:predicted protein [Chaetoceros tenuissimus]|uniref:Uncharacterized protein n=1 Tax=Chaetoceros tenuissimus TaxID=426638 RepID=A0AAD3HFI0_9STRA|nr:predicted protein [Chaetoceros tenuissimus]